VVSSDSVRDRDAIPFLWSPPTAAAACRDASVLL
jgi:hypothetical protein